MSFSPKLPASPAVDDKESEGDTSKSSTSNQQPKPIQHNEQSTSESRDVTSNSSISPTNYNYLKALQFSKPTSDSDDSTDGFPKYGPKRSDTLPNSYFSSLSTYGMNNSELNLDSYSSDDDYKARLKVLGKGKSLLKKNVFKCSKRRSGDSRLKDSILSSYAEICYKCKLCKVSPCYMASVESFIFHMKNQHSDIYKDILLKPVTNGNCHPVEMTKTIDGSSSDDASCTNIGRITSEHLLKYSKLWQNSPKSSATDPKSTEETKSTPSTSSSKPTTPVPTQIQKVTEQFLKSCDNLSLPGKQTNSHIGGSNHTDRSKSTSTSINTSKKSPSSPSTTAQNGWLCDLPPSFTPEFGRYTKLVREGGNIVYFCQVCNWKCQVKAAFGVHCNGQQHHTKARLADQNNFDKCKQKSEPNNVKAAIRKAIDYRDNLNKQQATNSSNASSNNANSVKLPIINVPKVPTFNKVLPTESDSTKQLLKQGDINEKQNDIDKLEIRNKRKRPFPVRRSSADGDDWVDSESEDDSSRKRKRPDTIIEPLPKKVINPFLSHYPSMIPMDDYFSRYSSPKQHSIGSILDNEEKVTKIEAESRDKDASLNLPLFPTGSTGLLPESREENLDIQFRCTFCNVYCAGASDYKDHFRTEHDIDTPDLSMADGKGSQNNEWWKMMKIKETLPDTLVSCPKGNVSRDLLLHKVSLTLNMPEVVRWGPSCNKAVREEFPNSLAQRKGKFKKYPLHNNF
ncbi:hypothetical protein LOTGIDRAFT_162313 [Lottia gigantea]|uniref:C2H2-type domain-containing protein n=1 Tax=Lottia gigantea TaxID=225164 RepID=V4A805_LOTGI|nr:hypothetical protein LOTGIDRAFT_162313 [Lottia gigantea]ESO92837.1 hypothetical protein LOTGIDRAFT_162313 [Lottia gigantea]